MLFSDRLVLFSDWLVLFQALELTEQELNEHSYVWKCLVMISGIYVFFIIERILKIITERTEVIFFHVIFFRSFKVYVFKRIFKLCVIFKIE